MIMLTEKISLKIDGFTLGRSLVKAYARVGEL